MARGKDTMKKVEDAIDRKHIDLRKLIEAQDLAREGVWVNWTLPDGRGGEYFLGRIKLVNEGKWRAKALEQEEAYRNEHDLALDAPIEDETADTIFLEAAFQTQVTDWELTLDGKPLPFSLESYRMLIKHATFISLVVSSQGNHLYLERNEEAASGNLPKGFAGKPDGVS